jgi:uncharacterized membrane protein
MSELKTKAELVNLILGDEEDKKLEEEEILHLLLQRKVTKNINRVQNENLTLSARMADNIAKFTGSWTFILTFMSCLVLWIVVNSFLLIKAFDAYPFILLNLIQSCVAAIQAPVIMMSQNRQEEKDRLRSQNDYKTNLKSEIIIEDLHQKLDQVLVNQEEILLKIRLLEDGIVSNDPSENS